MPHLQHTSPEALDMHYPRIVPPEEEQLDDIDADEQDAVYQHGLAIARQIQLEAAESGRRRHVSSSSQCGGQKDRKGNVNSITNSTSEPCRRRSNKSCCPSSCNYHHFHHFHDYRCNNLMIAPAERHDDDEHDEMIFQTI